MTGVIRKRVLSAAVMALVASGASSTDILRQHLTEREGLELRAYQDGAHVWTICQGKTEGVKRGDTATSAYCVRWLDSEMGRRFAAVDRMVSVSMSAPRRAGVTSHCFNVGITACEKSTLIRELNAGRPVAACDSILLWKYITREDVKFDCSTPRNRICSGLWDRRLADRELCLL